MEQIKKRLRDSRNGAYSNIAKIKATFPGIIEQKAYERQLC